MRVAVIGSRTLTVPNLADYEGRSINSHILVLVRKSIQEFEAIHGRIEESIPPDVNVKPVGKHRKAVGSAE